jgi:hypothetical protein
MPSSRRPAPRARPPAKKPARRRPPSSGKVAVSVARKAPNPPPRTALAPASKPALVSSAKIPELEIPLPGGRHHVLSLSFVRDGDEFLARMETDGGHITELKNRSLDQLLSLVANELEDLLE